MVFKDDLKIKWIKFSDFSCQELLSSRLDPPASPPQRCPWPSGLRTWSRPAPSQLANLYLKGFRYRIYAVGTEYGQLMLMWISFTYYNNGKFYWYMDIILSKIALRTWYCNLVYRRKGSLFHLPHDLTSSLLARPGQSAIAAGRPALKLWPWIPATSQPMWGLSRSLTQVTRA